MPLPLAPTTVSRIAQAPGDSRHLERLAAEFAAMDAETAEALLDSLAAQAIARWRLADATGWQRVKFRARLVRASQRAPLPPESARGEAGN